MKTVSGIVAAFFLVLWCFSPVTLAGGPSWWNGPWPDNALWFSCCTFMNESGDVLFIPSGGTRQTAGKEIPISLQFSATIVEFLQYNIDPNPDGLVFGNFSPLQEWMATMCVKSNTNWQYSAILDTGGQSMPEGVSVGFYSAWREPEGLDPSWQDQDGHAVLPVGFTHIVFFLEIEYDNSPPDTSDWILSIHVFKIE